MTRTFDGGRVMPPAVVMTNQQLTIAAHNMSGGLKGAQELIQAHAQTLSRLEKKVSALEGQNQSLLIANRVQKRFIIQIAAISETDYHRAIGEERGRFAAEMAAFQAMQVEQEIAATEKTLQQGVAPGVKATLVGKLAGLRAQLQFLKGEASGDQQPKDESTGSGSEGLAQRQGGGRGETEEASGPEEGQATGG